MINKLFVLVYISLQLQCIEGQVFTCRDGNTICIEGTICARCPNTAPYCSASLERCISSNPDGTVSCPRDGALPSLESCRSYSSCLTGRALPVACPLGTVFDPATGSCQRGRPCYRFLCRRIDEGQYVAYPGDPSLYALCLNLAPVYLRACQPGLVFDKTSQSCQQFCPGIGDFIDYNSDNCKCYYRCRGVGVNVGVAMCCDSGKVFSVTEGRCSTPTDRDRAVCAVPISTTVQP